MFIFKKLSNNLVAKFGWNLHHIELEENMTLLSKEATDLGKALKGRKELRP